MMKNPIEEYMSLSSYAVAGASRRKEKFGYKVMQDLIARGKTVYPINPGADEIDGIPCYSSIKDVPETPDAVHFITPPAITERIAKEMLEMGIKYAWMQPGAESETAIKMLEDASVTVLANVCVLRT